MVVDTVSQTHKHRLAKNTFAARKYISTFTSASTVHESKVSHLVRLEPVFDDVGLVVGDGHTVTYTQHLQQIQKPEVLQQEQQEKTTEVSYNIYYYYHYYYYYYKKRQ